MLDAVGAVTEKVGAGVAPSVAFGRVASTWLHSWLHAVRRAASEVVPREETGETARAMCTGELQGIEFRLAGLTGELEAARTGEECRGSLTGECLLSGLDGENSRSRKEAGLTCSRTEPKLATHLCPTLGYRHRVGTSTLTARRGASCDVCGACANTAGAPAGACTRTERPDSIGE